MDVNHDYNAAFKSISVKLKKRFYKKPNVSDAIDEYTTLIKQLENEECFGLSAYCMQQVAKSFHSVGNTISESAALQQSAKLYLNAHIGSCIETGIVTFDEDLQSAISMYEETIRLHCEQNERQQAAKLSLELADLLACKFDRYFESITYYERAIVLYSPLSPLDQSNSLQIILIKLKLAALKVFTCDYSGALTLYTEVCTLITSKCTTSVPNSDSMVAIKHKPIGLYSTFLVESEISKLLLLIYMKPTKMRSEHSSTIDAFCLFQTDSSSSLSSPTSYLPLSCMDRDLFILMQSFVMACQSNRGSNDAKLIYTLQTELWPYLNEVQNYLVDLITDQLLNSSYTDDLLTNHVT